jgi:hypothetical protein
MANGRKWHVYVIDMIPTMLCLQASPPRQRTSTDSVKVIALLLNSEKGKGHPITDHQGPREGVEV